MPRLARTQHFGMRFPHDESITSVDAMETAMAAELSEPVL